MQKTMRVRFIILALLLTASIVPNLGIQVNTFGFSWNFYRIVIVSMVLVTLVLFRGELQIRRQKGFLLWMGFLVVWFVYGLIQIISFPYADMSRGMQELFTILCAIFVFYIFSCISIDREEYERLMRIVFFLLLALILLGFFEIITGKHMSTSMFNDPANKVAWKMDSHSAAGIMYNVNDFSALITLMCPLAIGRYRIQMGRVKFDLGWILLVCVFLINRQNTANICNMAIIAGILLYLILMVMKDRRKVGMILLILLLVAAVGVALIIILGADQKGLVGQWADQLTEYDIGKGSMHARLLIYQDALSVSWATGLMGLGPGGFPVYFGAHGSSSGFINPHSYLLEILSQYGILILFAFLTLLGYMVYRALRLLRSGASEDTVRLARTVVLIVAMLLITSFASSSYMLNNYNWGILALLILGLEMEEHGGHEKVWG